MAVLKEACEHHEWKKEKYYLSLHVQKPNNRGDAINYLDAIADVVKHAIGIDDNYMEVEKITYEVVRNKEDLKIYISVAQ